MSLYSLDKKERIDFFEQASCPICSFSVENLSISNFSFNSHHGACPDCHGLGSYTTFREEDIVNPRLSLAEGAILPWSAHPYYIAVLEAVCTKHGIDINAMYGDLSKKDREKILYGVP